MYKRYAVLVAPCMLAPGLQAAYKELVPWGTTIIDAIMSYQIDIIPLPCVESAFGGYEKGLKREKHGIHYYLKQDGYCEHCRCAASSVYEMIDSMTRGGYHFLAVLGVEHSPNCAVSYLYSHEGMLKRPGIFMEMLMKMTDAERLEIRYIGINRKYPRKALRELEELMKRARGE